MSIESQSHFETTDDSKVHSVDQLLAAVRTADREKLKHTDPQLMSALIVAGLTKYIADGQRGRVDDATPENADENKIVMAWNDMLAFVDSHMDRIRARNTTADERSARAQWPNEDPHINDYQLAIPQQNDRDDLHVLSIDFLYHIYINQRGFDAFIAHDLRDQEIQRDSRMHLMCKDKPWWKDDYLYTKGN